LRQLYYKRRRVKGLKGDRAVFLYFIQTDKTSALVHWGKLCVYDIYLSQPFKMDLYKEMHSNTIDKIKFYDVFMQCTERQKKENKSKNREQQKKYNGRVKLSHIINSFMKCK